MIAAGVGFSSACTAGELETLVRETLWQAEATAPAVLVTHVRKADSDMLRQAAATLELPLRFVESADLEAAEDRTVTRSARVETVAGIASLAEAAALVGAGQGARLLVARRSSAHATCAVATSGDEA